MYQHGSRRAADPVIAFKDLGIQNFTAADIDYRIRETFNAKLTAEALRPIFFDLEEQSQFAKGKNFCDSVIKAFCGELEKNGYLAGLYCSTYYLNNFVSNNVAGKYPLWVAQYNYRCTYTANKYGIWQYSSEGRVNGISEYGIWQYSSEGRVNGINGNVDMNYCYTDYPTIVKNGGYNDYKKPNTPEKKTVTQLAKEVIEGKWSARDERRQKLTAAGYNYSAVQKKVNELCEKMKINKIAQEVIQGKWGNGEERHQKLTDAGYDYDKVQARVNELMKEQ